MENQRKGLTQRLRMLSKAHVDSFDRCAERLHDRENQSVAEDKGKNHIHDDCTVANVWRATITLMNQDGPSENNNNTCNRTTYASAHVRRNILVNDWFHS